MEIETSSPATQPPSFLSLPLELREKIYRNLLSIKHTKIKYVHDAWDSHYALAVASGHSAYLPPVIVPSSLWKTKYNFQTAILATNRQINEEAGPILGWKNQWVILTVPDPIFAIRMQQTGSCILIPTRRSALMDQLIRRACVFMALQLPRPGATTMIMDVDGVTDLVSALSSENWQPHTIAIRIVRENLIPRSSCGRLVEQLLGQFRWLRLRWSEQSLGGPYMYRPNIRIQTYESDQETSLNITSMARYRFDTLEMLQFLRNQFTPLGKVRGDIDWLAEEASMHDWCYHFMDGVRKYGLQLRNNNTISTVWKNTGSMAHTKLGIIKLHTGDRSWAHWHMNRANDIGDVPIYIKELQWYYSAAMVIINTRKLRPGDHFFEILLDLGWRLSLGDVPGWWTALCLWLRWEKIEGVGAASMLGHLVRRALPMTSGIDNRDTRMREFDMCMASQVQANSWAMSSLTPEKKTRLEQLTAKYELKWSYVQKICADLSIPVLNLHHVVS